MITSATSIRVRYGETDQMGIVYYGAYALYYEVGRVELLRTLGMTYRDLEAQGVLMPVTEFHVRYLRPARYDEELVVHTSVREMPAKRITFWCDTRNSNGELLNSGHVTLAFVEAGSMRAITAPQVLQNLLKPHFA
jgi:acyl-CoA thioester hydrolase